MRKAPNVGVKTVARRRALCGIGAVLAFPMLGSSAVRAQAAWPVRPVRYINPYPAGGATDTLSRLLCAKLTELTGQQFIVDNLGGGDGGHSRGAGSTSFSSTRRATARCNWCAL